MQTASTATILINYGSDGEPAPFTASTATATAYTMQQEKEEFERLRRDYVFRVR